jgi:hypothetical protein
LLCRRRCCEPRDDDAADVALQSQEDVTGETLNEELTESREGLAVEGEVAAEGTECTG